NGLILWLAEIGIDVLQQRLEIFLVRARRNVVGKLRVILVRLNEIPNVIHKEHTLFIPLELLFEKRLDLAYSHHRQMVFALSIEEMPVHAGLPRGFQESGNQLLVVVLWCFSVELLKDARRLAQLFSAYPVVESDGRKIRSPGIDPRLEVIPLCFREIPQEIEWWSGQCVFISHHTSPFISRQPPCC